jgi:hypothetical protein
MVTPSTCKAPPGDGCTVHGDDGSDLDAGDAEDLVGLIGLPLGPA